MHWQDTLPEITVCPSLHSYAFSYPESSLELVLWFSSLQHTQGEPPAGWKGGYTQCARGVPVALPYSCPWADKPPSWRGPDGCYVPQKPITCTGGLNLDCLKKATPSKRGGRFSSPSTIGFSEYWATCLNDSGTALNRVTSAVLAVLSLICSRML